MLLLRRELANNLNLCELANNLNLHIQAPVASIAYAAGFDPLAVVEKLLEEDNPYLGYDSAKGLYLLNTI